MDLKIKKLLKMLLSYSLKNHFEASLSILLMSIGTFFLLVFFNFDIGMTIICLIPYLLFVFPGIYLHVEYWFVNKGERYIINPDSMVRIKSKKEQIYYSNDIEKIVVYGSATLFKTWFHLSAMEQYHFARIFLKNGEKINITCLMTPRVDKALKILRNVRMEKEKGLFNSTLV